MSLFCAVCDEGLIEGEIYILPLVAVEKDKVCDRCGEAAIEVVDKLTADFFSLIRKQRVPPK